MTTESGLATINEVVEKIAEREAVRRDALQAEIDALDDADATPFARTRAEVAAERGLLQRLDSLLTDEAEHVEALADSAAHLTVEQAVRNRDDALRKLEQHNEDLRTFHRHMTAALDAVETNLDQLEADPDGELPADAEPHLADARDALQSHNEVVAGLDTNLRILGAYMA